MLSHFFKLKLKPSDLRKPTVIILFLSNLLPLYGVLFLGWEVFPILVLFWTENVIIGFFNVLKMIMCAPTSTVSWVAKLFVVPFFILHYGVFTMAHGLIVYALFGGSVIGETEIPDFSLTLIWQIMGSHGLIFGFLSLFVSHGISFVVNYIHKGEYKEAGLWDLGEEPYKRVLILHLTIIFGGFILLALGSPVGGLILLVVLKMVIDAMAHIKLHS